MKKNFGRKVGACVLAASMVLSMTACNNATSTDGTKGADTTSTEAASTDGSTTDTSADATTEATTTSTDVTEGQAPDWSAYDALIDQIRTTTDFVALVDLMHQAEDMLMYTWSVIPIYY